MHHTEPPAVMTRLESCTTPQVRRVAAMLDLDPDEIADGQHLVRGWHFLMLAGDTRRSSLRGDGFPGLGVPMPDLGLPRLLLAGRTVSWTGDIRIGDPVERRSTVAEITEKEGASGRMALVTLCHELWPLSQQGAAVIETQTYALLPAASGRTPPAPSRPAPDAAPDALLHHMTPDQTLLFQYSALGFNSHKIHLDRDHARNVEGLPDLVVNGGLSTLLATEFLRAELGVTPRALRVRHMAPLFCDRPMTLRAEPLDTGWRVRILDDAACLAAELELDT